jgi:hypothetical protein
MAATSPCTCPCDAAAPLAGGHDPLLLGTVWQEETTAITSRAKKTRINISSPIE